MFGSYPSTWSVSYDFDSVKAGDIVRYGISGSVGHSIFVTNVSGRTITFVDCNGNGNYSENTKVRTCGIKWDNTTTIGSSLFGHSFSYIRKSPGIDVSKPSAPKDVLASTTNGELNIKWSSVSGATSYVVYVYSKSNCSEYAFKKEVTACSVSGIQLNPGRYWICVHAINSVGAGPGSNFVDYLTGPKNLKASRVDTSIKLSWDSVPNANCYDVIMTDPKGNQNWLHTDKAEKTITNCIPGNYKFEVQSLYRNNGSTNGQVVGAHSDVVSYYFGLSAPKNLKVNNNDGNMNISWDKVDGATCYDVIIITPNGKNRLLALPRNI